MEQATFGAGCFWCVEAVFTRLEGVEQAISGYAGGATADPSYEEVSGGKTGHAEVVQITFDPAIISYEQLLNVFWKTHDPTSPNRQGADIGTQYRSVVFCHSESQKKLAEDYKKQLDASGVFENPIVTEIVPFENFYPAENYHQNYYLSNPEKAYCQIVIAPKIKKMETIFNEKLKQP